MQGFLFFTFFLHFFCNYENKYYIWPVKHLQNDLKK